jgi:hypothetical protein
MTEEQKQDSAVEPQAAATAQTEDYKDKYAKADAKRKTRDGSLWSG